MVAIKIVFLSFSALMSTISAASVGKMQAFNQGGSLSSLDKTESLMAINVTHSQFISRRDTQKESKSINKGGKKKISEGLLRWVSKIFRKVKITWYTGNDLKRPSCWAKQVWTPTDESRACAVTEFGWKDKPKCFDFLKLCKKIDHTGKKKCTTVRVVDSCAGCEKGSQHVDLTPAAFKMLASLSEGVLDDVEATIVPKPDEKDWNPVWWGPFDEPK
ncbi:expansin family protein [Mycena floridula]|nr:expansin family protein [Mycena floridula]